MNKKITEYRITFGKHKGLTLDDIPASYLRWLSEQEWVSEQYPEIASYLKKNEAAIEQEIQEDEAIMDCQVDAYDFYK